MDETIISISSAESGPGGIYPWGLEIIRALQALENPALTALVKAFTTLGTEFFYLPVLLLIFWCVDEKKGFRLAFLVLFSAWVNVFFKGLLKLPRPYNLDPSVGRAFEMSYGFPSGHAQNTLVFWGSLGFKGPFPLRAGAVFIVLAIAFTRLYLGVHFPTDILGGWLLGALILVVQGLFGEKIAAFLAAQGTRVQLIVAAALVLAMNALYPADKSLGGLFLGFAGGYALTLKRFPFKAREGRGPLTLALRCVLGFAGAGLIFGALRWIFPGEGSLFAAYPLGGEYSPYRDLGRFLRYGFLGLWAAGGAPWLFLRLGLAKAPGEG